MAVRAAKLALQQRHVRPALEFCMLGLVALEAGLIDAFPCRQPARTVVRHRVMTVGATNLIAIMDTGMPEDALTALMAGQTLTVLLGQRRLALLGESNDFGQV